MFYVTNTSTNSQRLYQMAATKSDVEQFADKVLSESKADFVYLPRKAQGKLGAGRDALYSRYANWSEVVILTSSLFGKNIGFTEDTPDWLRAGCLFARICIQQCQNLSTKELPGNITRGETIVGPTYPHEYLGYARRCFNSGLAQANSYAGVEISRDDWSSCQGKMCIYPIQRPDWELCRRLAHHINTEGQKLLGNPPPANGKSHSFVAHIDNLVAQYLRR
jgi:hypothetical protein